jgi:AcrR family transcriptional regulator
MTPELTSEDEVRTRIIDAAFAAFISNGYAATSTLDIATRARVSKRELYARVGNKKQMLLACVGARAGRFQLTADLPLPRDRESLAQVLTALGARLVREISDPTVVAVFRLAIAEALQAPEVAQVLDRVGRETSRAAVRHVMAHAQTNGLLDGQPADLSQQFGGLLWGDLLVSLLLGVARRPTPREILARAEAAAAAFLRLQPSGQ